MEILIKFIEDQLDLAVKYRGETYLVRGFRHQASGAAQYARYSAIVNGDYKLLQEINELWNNKYYEKFMKLENSAG